jgi:ribosomal-protein-alanine N-acetyltransferase
MLLISSNPFPVLQTSRLVLRQMQVADTVQVFQLRSDPEVNRFLYRPAATNASDEAEFIDRINGSVSKAECLYWAIQLNEEVGLIGTVCLWNIDQQLLSGELGYEMLPAYQGRGLMLEAISSVIEFAFNQTGLKSLNAFSRADNIRSVRLLEKLGFKIAADDEVELLYTLDRAAFV